MVEITKTWCPTLTHLHNMPHNVRTLPEKQVKCIGDTTITLQTP